MNAIRAVLLILSSLTALDVRPAGSEIYRPWCAQYFGRGSSTNCGFTSYEQCMMTATPGSGAWCVRNTWAVPNGSGQNAGNTRRARRY